MKRLKTMSLFLCLMVFATAIQAQEKMHDENDFQEKFARLDLDDSGQISMEEYIAHKQEKWEMEDKAMTEEDQEKLSMHFAKLDTNEDGEINFGEFTAYMKKKKMSKKHMKEKDWKKKKKMKQREKEDMDDDSNDPM